MQKQPQNIVIKASPAVCWKVLVIYAILAILLLWLFWAFTASLLNEGPLYKNITYFIMYGLPIILLMFLCLCRCIAVVCSFDDYIRFSGRGLELHLHPKMKFWQPSKTFIRWDNIERYTVYKNQPNPGIYLGRYMLIQLKHEAEPRRYYLSNLCEDGSNVPYQMKQHRESLLDATMSQESKEEHRFSWRDLVAVLVFLAGLVGNLLTLMLFDITFVPGWSLLLVVALSACLMTYLLRHSKWDKGGRLCLGLGTGMLFCLAFLYVNGKFANKETEPVIRKYPIVKTSILHITRANYAYAYLVTIDTGKDFKSLTVGLNRGQGTLSAKQAELTMYRGFFGFYVIDEIDLYQHVQTP